MACAERESEGKVLHKGAGLCIRYHLMVAFMLQRQGITVAELVRTAIPREAVEHQLSALKDW